jgi:poly-gamma-glutamate synthesis protein (capsule biosynthesis protein)
LDDPWKDRAGYAWLFSVKLEKEIKAIKKDADHLILMAHAGVENINFPIIEWRQRYRRLCELGVDIIIGHHPHVPQGYERFEKSLIFYSLGNFYFGQKKNEGDQSFSVQIALDDEKKYNFKSIFHEHRNQSVHQITGQKSNFSLNSLNDLLGEGYFDRVEKTSEELFQTVYKKYYRLSAPAFGGNDGWKRSIKNKVKALIGRKSSMPELLLLHNIKIESHRFIVQRALRSGQ